MSGFPVHRELAAKLSRDSGHMSLLTKAGGSGFDADSLSMWFADAIDQADLPDAA